MERQFHPLWSASSEWQEIRERLWPFILAAHLESLFVLSLCSLTCFPYFFLQIELFQGNDIRVMHIPEINDFSAEKQTFSVRIHEDSWMRADRLLVNREHLLMALADVDFILIRATDSKGTKETA